jgi:hypothetical protein
MASALGEQMKKTSVSSGIRSRQVLITAETDYQQEQPNDGGQILTVSLKHNFVKLLFPEKQNKPEPTRTIN